MTKTIAVPSQPIRKLTTPQLLKGGLYFTWGTSLLLLIATISGVQGQRHSIKTIGKDAVPSIINAQRIKHSLAGMDANAVNELIVKPGYNPQAIINYEERRHALAERLVAAAESISYDEAERKPILAMQVAVGEYIAKIQQARDFNQRGDAAAVLGAYRAAAEIMDKTLLPAADELDKVNLQILERTYAQQRFASARSLFYVVIFGLLLIGVLVALQLFLSRRMRRTLNPMLLAASAIALFFLSYTIHVLGSGIHHLKVAKEETFRSIHSLQKARTLAYIIKADESRYLLDRQRAAIHEQNFFNRTAQLATLPPNQTYVSIFAAASQAKKIEGFTGYLADSLNNITLPGERETAMVSLYMFGDYIYYDQKIRQLVQSGKYQEAIALGTGYNEGRANWAFEQFKQANQQTIDINTKAFDQAIEQGFDEVDGFEITTPVAVGLVALLTLFGLMPRLKEYS
jgi:hypothetical protein